MTLNELIYETETLHNEVSAYLQYLKDMLEDMLEDTPETKENRFTITDLGLEALELDEIEVGMYYAGELVL